MVDVLLVEDRSLQAGLISAYLREDHSVVGWTRDAEDVVGLVAETDPDAIVMDIKLEQGNGIEATAAIKAEYPDIPIIISTANAAPETVDRVRAAGADAYLIKPYTKDVLCEYVERLCSAFEYPAFDYYAG